MRELLDGIPSQDAVRLEQVPFLPHATSVTPLDGGITNRNYRLRTPDGDHVVRLSDPGSSALAIDRENEYVNSCRAAESGAAPDVTAYLRGQGILCVRWVEGRTFNEDDVARNLGRIAVACRLLHAGPSFANAFDMFDIQARYLDLVQTEGYRLPPRYLDFAEQVDRMKTVMRRTAEPLVPCNNDLLAANFIDDGDRVWLIDYEYSGNNEASFELGNVWSESTLPDEALDELTTAYWGAHHSAKVARARLWALMSKYGWTLWASIQDAVSPIEFDYWTWGMEKYERAVEEFDGPLFDDWIAAIAAS